MFGVAEPSLAAAPDTDAEPELKAALDAAGRRVRALSHTRQQLEQCVPLPQLASAAAAATTVLHSGRH